MGTTGTGWFDERICMYIGADFCNRICDVGYIDHIFSSDFPLLSVLDYLLDLTKPPLMTGICLDADRQLNGVLRRES